MRLHDLNPNIPPEWADFMLWQSDQYGGLDMEVYDGNIRERNLVNGVGVGHWTEWDRTLWEDETNRYYTETDIDVPIPEKFR